MIPAQVSLRYDKLISIHIYMEILIPVWKRGEKHWQTGK